MTRSRASHVVLPLVILAAAQGVSTQLASGPSAGLLVPSLPAFAALQRARQTLAALERRCRGTHGAHVQAYRTLERVVAFESQSDWPTQGIGTLLWWYAGAFEMGRETRRAAFFSNGAGAKAEQPTSDAYELNRDFHADTLDGTGQMINWNWADASVRANVSAAMRARHGLAGADVVIDSFTPCQNRAFVYKVTRSGAAHDAHEGAPASHGGRRAAQPIQQVCDRLRLAQRGAAAAAPVDDGAGGVYFATLRDALRSVEDARWVSVRLWSYAIGSLMSKWSLQWLAMPLSRLGGFECAVAAILRPAPHIQRALVPLLRAASGEEASGGVRQGHAPGPLVALHVRTLSLDIVSLLRVSRHARAPVPAAPQRCAGWQVQRQAALLGLAPRTKPSAAWQLFDEMADDACRPCAGEPARSPALCDGLPGRQGHAPGAGALTHLLSCALARSTARGRESPKALGRVFLATDSAGLVALVGATAWLSSRVLLSEKSPAHVQCDRTRARDHDSCDSAERQRDAAIKSAVDLVMLASADVVAQFSTSTFFGAAVAANPHLAPVPRGQAGTPPGACFRRVWSRRPESCNSTQARLEAWEVMFDDRCAGLAPARRAPNQRD